jgi:hypothetical protein
MYMNVYSNIIHTIPELDYIAIKRRINKNGLPHYKEKRTQTNVAHNHINIFHK